MNNKIVLRFRDLVKKTIFEHLSVIDEYGHVWWGWWSKDNEQVPGPYISILQDEIDTEGYIWIYLADSGSYRLYKAKLIEIDYADDGGKKKAKNSDLVPSYYRKSKYKMWFKFSAIEDVLSEEIRSWSYDNCDDLFCIPQTGSLKCSQVESIESLLDSNHQTIYFIQKSGTQKKSGGINSQIKEESAEFNTNITNPEEKHFRIEDGSCGFSYETLFGAHLENAKIIEVIEPYLTAYHQKQNFLHFCSIIVKFGKVEKISLVTKPGDRYQKEKLIEVFDGLSSELETHGISFTYSFSTTVHARSIKTDSGWIIKCDRGLDIFQRPEGELDSVEQLFRPCKRCEIDIFKEGN